MNVKTIMAVGLAGACLLAIGGCASMKDKDARSLGTSTHQDDVDAAYVAYVNSNAKQHDVQVYWINPPVKAHTTSN